MATTGKLADLDFTLTLNQNRRKQYEHFH